MLKHIPTGHIFEDRKTAKKILGRKRYTDISLRNEWEYIENE